ESKNFDLTEWKYIVTVALGETEVKCTLGCELGEMNQMSQTKGQFKIKCDSNLNAEFRPTKKSLDQLLKLARTLEKTFVQSNCVNLDSLCLLKDKLAWNLLCNVEVVNNSGSINFCCSIAILVCLQFFKLPSTLIEINDKASVIIKDPRIELPVPLSIMHHPLIINCCIFQNQNDIKFFYDPTNLEEYMADGIYAFSLNNLPEICASSLSGHIALDDVTIKKMCDKAFSIYLQIMQQIETIIEKMKNKLTFE
ncbi:MAG: Exosome complex component RRP45, partial [Paramarteilia canceri]